MAGSAPSTSRRVPLRAAGLLAGEAAKRLSIGVQTLHYYEREGLIPAPPRSESGYRLYTPELVERVRFIRKAQALGLPLDEIRDVLRLADQGASPCGRVQRALGDTLAEVDRRLEQLQSFRRDLAALVDRAADLGVPGAERSPTSRGTGQVCVIVEQAPVLPATAVARHSAVPSGRGDQKRRSGADRRDPAKQARRE